MGRYLTLLLLAIVIWSPSLLLAERLDRSFGGQGVLLTRINHYGDQAVAVAVQDDGKIIVAGSSNNGADLDFALARYNADGTLDKSFNFDGTLTLPVGSKDDGAMAVAVAADGTILAAGYTENGKDRDVALVRINPDGSLYRNFGQEGVVVTSIGNSDDEAAAIHLNDDGSLYVAGIAAGTAGRVISLLRYLPDGSLDPGFGEQGMALAGVGQDVLIQDMAVQDSGRIVVAGSYSEGEQVGLVLVAFDGAGIIDTSFGVDGVGVIAENHPLPSEGYALTLLEDGSLLVAGSVGYEGERDAALFLFDQDGHPVEEFGDQGMLVVGAVGGDDVFYGVDASGGDIVASGFADTESGKDFLYYSRSLDEIEHASDPVVEVRPVTRMRLGKLQVVDSFTTFRAGEEDDEGSGVPGVRITSLSAGDDVSYGVVLDKTGRGVAVGMADDGGITAFALAGYKESAPTAKTAADGGGSGYARTLQISEVTRTGAFVACETHGSGITERGVVYSIAPYPVLDTGSSSGENNGPTPVTGPKVTNTTPSTFTGTSITLSVTTDVNATCKFSKDVDADYNAMTQFSATGTTTHSQEITGLDSANTYTYYVRCKDLSSQAVNTAGTKITFTGSDATISPPTTPKRVVQATLSTVGDFLVSPAMAAETPTSSGLFSTESTEYADSGSVKVGAGTGAYTGILKDLKPGTFYYVRAYAKVGETVYYGNQLGFKTADACFVATAAYGSIFHPFVRVLREFRDQFLLGFSSGRQFVSWYYRVSPPLAEIISGAALLRYLTCILLLPLVGFAWSLIHLGVIGTVFLVVLLTAAGRILRTNQGIKTT